MTQPNPRPIFRTLQIQARWIHTYLSMLAMLLLLFFGATGFMLNHSEWFGLDATQTSERQIQLDPALQGKIDRLQLVEYLRAKADVRGLVQPFDLPEPGQPFHVAFKAPQVTTDVDISLADLTATVTTETRGVMGLLTRLHTAREAGGAWQLVLDVASLLLVVASVTGFVIWTSVPRYRVPGIIALTVCVAGMIGIYAALVP
jgi:hypothetical protein